MLNNALALSFGNPVGFAGLITAINPGNNIYTGAINLPEMHEHLYGQVRFSSGDRSARLVYLLPGADCQDKCVVSMLEYLCVKAGEWGALHVLAEIEETSPFFESFRYAGFTVFARQSVVCFENLHMVDISKLKPGLWKPATTMDEPAIRSLFQSLVPPLAQSAEPLPEFPPGGLVYRHRNELVAYVDGIYGTHGIYLIPYIHPEVGNCEELISDLLLRLPRFSRRVYLVIRSYQAWLEDVISDFQTSISPHQAVMVKHLVSNKRVFSPSLHQQMLENRNANPAIAPFSRYYSNENHSN